MQLIFYISVYQSYSAVNKIKKKKEIRSNNRPKLREKENVIWKGNKSRRIGEPRPQIQPYPFNRKITDVQEKCGQSGHG